MNDAFHLFRHHPIPRQRDSTPALATAPQPRSTALQPHRLQIASPKGHDGNEGHDGALDVFVGTETGSPDKERRRWRQIRDELGDKFRYKE